MHQAASFTNQTQDTLCIKNKQNTLGSAMWVLGWVVFCIQQSGLNEFCLPKHIHVDHTFLLPKADNISLLLLTYNSESYHRHTNFILTLHLQYLQLFQFDGVCLKVNDDIILKNILWDTLFHESNFSICCQWILVHFQCQPLIRPFI